MLDSAGMTTYEHLAKDQKKKGRFMLSITLVLLLVLLWPFSLHAQAPFYQGKTIRLVAGTPAGSVYDLYARMVAQFIPKHIPGAPNVIVQNMPGVASMVAANYIYEVAKPDGLTIGSIQPALYFDQLVGRKEVKFDWQRFTWIGNTTVSHHLLYMRGDAIQNHRGHPQSFGAAQVRR
jgi:tripartite-type tricarboxylate transporter receptor subunit TctC